ncbi:MAG: GAF domain-containing protein, partial [Cyanobacteria bacterium P01_D01_bin.128]
MPQFLVLRSPQELELLNQQLQQEVDARKRTQHALQSLLEGTTATGEDFFPALAEHLAKGIRVRYAAISEYDAATGEIRILAFWNNGNLSQDSIVSPSGVPCEVVVKEGEAHYYPEAVQQLFPSVPALKEIGAACYLGVPILDRQNAVLGAICICHDQSLLEPEQAEAFMTIVASRASAELQRQRAEVALRQAYGEMEVQVQARTTDLSQVNQALTQVAKRERTTTRIIQRMRQTLDLEAIFRATTLELRQAIDCDRVIVYRFNPDWSGQVIAEAVAAKWRSLLDEDSESPWRANTLSEDFCTVRLLSDAPHEIKDTYLQDSQGGIFKAGVDFLPVTDIYERDFSDCYLELLESIQARAYVIMPVYAGSQLWGLMACYQNSAPRQWQDGETQMVTRVSAQLGVAIQQAELLQRSQQQAEDLKVAKEAADQANRAKSGFLSSMSHELRTPLNAILGFTQLMDHDKALSDRHQNYINIINSSGEHLLGLINNVLNLSKIEAGQLQLQPDFFDLPQLLQSVRDLFSLKAKSQGIKLQIITPDDLPTQVYGDQGKLRQVLINLLGNSIKFTRAGHVALAVEIAPAVKSVTQAALVPQSQPPEQLQDAAAIAVKFIVEDTGVGIASSEIDALFAPFQQTESGLKSGQGTGLGVPISRQYVQLMGGDLSVESHPGQGTRFWFTLPLAVNTAAQAPVQNGFGEIIGLAEDYPRYRILLAEDNDINRLLLQCTLAPLNLEVREVSSGQEALEIWETWRPHLIWMDMRMPNMDGYEATRRIRSAERDCGLSPTVIVALTATAFEENRPQILAAGCNDMVAKPFRPADLLRLMARHLHLRCRYGQTSPLSALAEPELTPDHLASLSTTWLTALYQAATECRD